MKMPQHAGVSGTYFGKMIGIQASSEEVHTNFRLIDVGGEDDGRCMFRSLVLSGQFIRLGKPLPDENTELGLADVLRNQVCDEYVRRREEVLRRRLVEGDFDEYVSGLRISSTWGGEPDLYVASHLLRTPITVYVNHKATAVWTRIWRRCYL